MAERINWTAFINQGVYGMPPPFEISRIPEIARNAFSHPFAQKIRTGVAEASRAWWDNVDPRKIGDKDTAWRIGLAVGLVESATCTFLLPGSGLAKGGINFAATQGAFIGARYLKINAEPQIRNFFKGVSAGGVFSLPFGVIDEMINGSVDKLSFPDLGQPPTTAPTPTSEVTKPITFPTIPESVIDRVSEFFDELGNTVHNATGLGLEQTPQPSSLVEPPTSPSPDVEPPASDQLVSPVDAKPITPPTGDSPNLVEGKIEQIKNSSDFATSLAASVGQNLHIQDEVIQSALAKQGKVITDLSPDALGAARKEIQTALENQVNLSANEVLHDTITASPIIDTSIQSTIELAKQATKAHFEQWLAESVNQEKLINISQVALGEQVAVLPVSFTTKVAQFLTENQTNSDLFTDHIMASGQTAGHLILKMGEDVRWDGSDWQAFALLNQLNPESFADLRTATGLSSQQLNDLITRIQNGDHEAYRELIRKMGLISAGSKVRLLTSEGMRRFLNY